MYGNREKFLAAMILKHIKQNNSVTRAVIECVKIQDKESASACEDFWASYSIELNQC